MSEKDIDNVKRFYDIEINHILSEIDVVLTNYSDCEYVDKDKLERIKEILQR